MNSSTSEPRNGAPRSLSHGVPFLQLAFFVARSSFWSICSQRESPHTSSLPIPKPIPIPPAAVSASSKTNRDRPQRFQLSSSHLLGGNRFEVQMSIKRELETQRDFNRFPFSVSLGPLALGGASRTLKYENVHLDVRMTSTASRSVGTQTWRLGEGLTRQLTRRLSRHSST